MIDLDHLSETYKDVVTLDEYFDLEGISADVMGGYSCDCLYYYILMITLKQRTVNGTNITTIGTNTML